MVKEQEEFLRQSMGIEKVEDEFEIVGKLDKSGGEMLQVDK